MSAAIFVAVGLALAWAIVHERGRRSRWREAERLSRCLFAAAGMRRRR